jgi:archaellum component FlaF (FlaF/FlaG flagellin family)
MENVIIALVCIALLISGVLSISQSALSSISTVSDALRQEEVLSRDMLSTSISCTKAVTNAGGTSVTIDVKNDGKKALANYSAWDVIVHYGNGDTKWIPYSTSTPGWTISGFFFPGRV